MDLKELKSWSLENILNLSPYWKKKAIDMLIDSISESKANEAIMHKETEIEAIIYDNKIETLEDAKKLQEAIKNVIGFYENK